MTHIYGIQKNGIEELIYKHREQTYGHGERGGEGQMYGKSNMETYITICKIANENLLYDSGNSNRGSCINLQGWNGEGDKREVQNGGDMCTPMADSC